MCSSKTHFPSIVNDSGLAYTREPFISTKDSPFLSAQAETVFAFLAAHICGCLNSDKPPVGSQII